VQTFNERLEWNLIRLQEELATERWHPGGYTEFWIRDPKERLISAAPYPDRVVHHALMNVLEPVFEPPFIFNSYACRPRGVGFQPAALAATPAVPGSAAGWKPTPRAVGHMKGTPAAVDRFQQTQRGGGW